MADSGIAAYDRLGGIDMARRQWRNNTFGTAFVATIVNTPSTGTVHYGFWFLSPDSISRG